MTAISVSSRSRHLVRAGPTRLVAIAGVAIHRYRRVVIPFELDSHPLQIERVSQVPWSGRALTVVNVREPGCPGRNLCTRNSWCSKRDTENTFLAEFGIEIGIACKPRFYRRVIGHDVNDISKTRGRQLRWCNDIVRCGLDAVSRFLKTGESSVERALLIAIIGID